MHDFHFETGPAAFLAGLVVSPHCAGMCAPLACALAPWPGTPESRTAFATGHHAARVVAYAFVGALAGGAGLRWGKWLDITPARWLPWALLVFYLLVALRLDRGLPVPGFVARLNARLLFRARVLPPPAAGALLGTITPLIPCGPLHAMFALAFLSASAARGAEIAAGFALGTLPLLWAAQAGFFRLRTRLGSERLTLVRRAAALLAAGILAWRILAPDTPSAFCG